MTEYAARDVEVLLPLYEVLKAKIQETGLAYTAEIEHRALPAVVWMSNAPSGDKILESHARPLWASPGYVVWGYKQGREY